MNIDNIHVTHNSLRNSKSICSMMHYVIEGGTWDKEALTEYAEAKKLARIAPIIAISKFPDGLTIVHDGHHRLVATYLAGRHELNPNEFELSEWSYDLYLEISHANGWYTPFDPRTTCRISNFAGFKKEARERFEKGEADVDKWIEANKDKFCEPRRIFTVAELAETVKATIRV